jgi:hypothetical protein
MSLATLDFERIASDTDGIIDGIPVREIIRDFFANSPTDADGKPLYGTADDISKEGCLALALKSNEVGGPTKGYVVWNAWREAFPVDEYKSPTGLNFVDFSKWDSRLIPITFRCFKFGSLANFDESHWGARTSFERAQWGTRAHFQNAVWENGAQFQDAQWGSYADFSCARWEEGADFSRACWEDGANFSSASWGRFVKFLNAKWGARANFSGAQWGDKADFQGAQWEGDLRGGGARFDGARWGDWARFEAAQWGHGAVFDGAQWGFRANFSGAQCGNKTRFVDAEWGDRVDFSGRTWEMLRKLYVDEHALSVAQAWAEKNGLAPDAFEEVSFHQARFLGAVTFQNRRYRSCTLFSHQGQRRRVKRDVQGYIQRDERNGICWELDPDQRQFLQAPKFHGCELHQDTSFDNADFPSATGSEEAARAYRTLKLAFSKQQAIREEQRFFRLEMEEETQRETGLKRWLFQAYKTLSDYGFSIKRPLTYGGLSVLALTVVYGLLSWLGQCGMTVQTCHFAPQWLEFSLLQTLPLPGLDKLSEAASKVFWPEGAWWGLCLSALVIIHKTLSLTALFLTGLALRNLFKLK